MRVKSLAIIEALIGLVLLCLTSPFLITQCILAFIIKGLMFIDKRTWLLRRKLGNWLLKHSWEAKHGFINNKTVIETWTATDYEIKFNGAIKRHAN